MVIISYKVYHLIEYIKREYDSGPKRYDYDAERKAWVYQRDGLTLDSLLKEELSLLLGSPVDL